MTSSAERVRRFRDRQRQAHPKEPLWRDLTGKLNVATTWLGLGNAAPASFVDAIEAVAAQIGLKLTEEPPAADSEPPRPAPEAFKEERTIFFEQCAQQLRDQLPKRAGDKFQRELDKFLRQLGSYFQQEIDTQINKQFQEQKEALTELEQEARAKDDAATKMLQGITAYMSEEDYNLIRGLLHPDRHQGEEQERYTRAFEAFKRLKDMIDPYIPVKALRARGWAK